MKLGLIILLERRMRSDLTETFKIIIEFLIMVEIFAVFLLELEIYCQKLSQQTNLFFCWQSNIFLDQIASLDQKQQ